MNRRMPIFVDTLLLSLSTAAVAQQKPSNTIDGSITFSELRANAPVGGCGCFWMAGGTGEISYQVWRNFSAVAEVAGHTTGHIPDFDTGLSLSVNRSRLVVTNWPSTSAHLVGLLMVYLNLRPPETL